MKRSNFISQLPIVLLCLLLISCSKKEAPLSNTVAQSSITRYYYVGCSNNGDTYIKASFLSGGGFDSNGKPFGTELKLAPGSTVTFNGETMPLKEGVFSGTSYTLEKKEWPSSASWVWKDADGKEYTDSYYMKPIQKQKKYIELQKKEYIFKLGVPLEAGETVQLTITGDQSAWEQTWTVHGPGPKHIILKDLTHEFDENGYHSINAFKTKVLTDKENKICISFSSSLENQ